VETIGESDYGIHSCAQYYGEEVLVCIATEKFLSTVPLKREKGDQFTTS